MTFAVCRLVGAPYNIFVMFKLVHLTHPHPDVLGNDDDDDEAKVSAAAAEIDLQLLSDVLTSGSHALSAVEKHMPRY